MSLILDALKKSDRERKRGAVPDLETVVTPTEPPRPPRRRWPLLLGIVVGLGVLAFAGGWWLMGHEGGGAKAPAPVASAARPIAKARPRAAAPKPAPTAPAAVPSTSRHRPEPVRKPAPKAETAPSPPVAAPKTPRAPATPAGVPATAAKPARGPLSLAELPAAVREGLPPLELSLHYYTTAPAARLIRLNGQLLREGEVSSQGLTVVEIRRDDVVLEREGLRFALPVHPAGSE